MIPEDRTAAGNKLTPRHLRKHIAWLAFAAMWLLVAAPPISQLLSVSPAMHGMAMPDAATHCDEHAGHGSDPSPPQPHAPSLSKCGYCDLLGHTPAVSSVAWLATSVPPSPYRSPWFVPERRTPRTLLLAAPPRGPPEDLNA